MPIICTQNIKERKMYNNQMFKRQKIDGGEG